MGVINDFDLSIRHVDDRKVGNERTGTLPFMAYDLLLSLASNQNIAHIYGLSYLLDSFATRLTAF